MIKFTQKEREFLLSLEGARIATVSGKMPHVKPVSYIFDDDAIYIATDYSTRTFKNLKENPHAAVTIDIYKVGGHKAVLIQGKVKIIEDGAEFDRIYAKFFEKFEWVRREPWKAGEAPFVKIIPTTKKSWGT
jgi:nitroimidazol reductase NimA-like FMN-containing flavoprotein (pyridoxamine 5'-phosphate oxidase superfamily)